MVFGNVSLVALRVFREVTERCTLTAAAGTVLPERRRGGVRLTGAAYVVFRR
ncbi:hypothetical protein ACQPZQ_24645 [Pseudonocardia sp. CA-142604]|uniref:hypothetical protein n=1 Tax=Pseudonocardia sp. CA-142604 TaxID=3240024 RepID=UPI003D9506F4